MRIFSKRSKQFEQQLEMRWVRLYRIAYSWCHDPQLASDLTQDALTKALRKHHQLKKNNALDAWLFTILNNCWSDHCRRKKETVDIDEVNLSTATLSDDDDERMLIVNYVHKAIEKLSSDQRQVVTLIDLEGMAYNEVASILDIPIGTVMSRLARARRQLKAHLQNQNNDTDSSSSNLWRVK